MLLINRINVLVLSVLLHHSIFAINWRFVKHPLEKCSFWLSNFLELVLFVHIELKPPDSLRNFDCLFFHPPFSLHLHSIANGLPASVLPNFLKHEDLLNRPSGRYFKVPVGRYERLMIEAVTRSRQAEPPEIGPHFLLSSGIKIGNILLESVS